LGFEDELDVLRNDSTDGILLGIVDIMIREANQPSAIVELANSIRDMVGQGRVHAEAPADVVITPPTITTVSDTPLDAFTGLFGAQAQALQES
jgi:hypothetical protein